MSDIIQQDLDFTYIPSTPGIYAIVNVVNQQMYIGSTKNLKKRAHRHFHRLAVGNHSNKRLRHAYSVYGPDAFRFDILEHVEYVKNLLAREQYYINKLKPQYNIARFASRNLGIMVRRHVPTSLHSEIQISIEEKELPAIDIQSNMQTWARMNEFLDKAGLVDSEKTMIAALITFTDAHGTTMSLKKLAKHQGYSERQVYNIIKSLKEKELIRVINTFRDDGSQEANTYDLSPLYQRLEHLN